MLPASITLDTPTLAPYDGPPLNLDWQTVPVSVLQNTPMARERGNSARIPRLFQPKTLDTYQAASAVHANARRVAKAYAGHFIAYKGEVDGLMLEGKPGSGKTHLAVGILHAILAAGFSGMYCNVPEFFMELRATYNADKDKGPDECEVITRTRGPQLLVLDDLGIEGRVLDPIRDKSSWLLDRIYLLINGRYEAGKPIIVTSNCNYKAIQAQFDERIASRLAEMTRYPFPPLPPNDYRLANMR